MNTQFITTTQLREQSSKVVSRLMAGEDVTLIHRSQIIGVIKPMQYIQKPFNVIEFKKLIKSLNIPRTTSTQREKIYRVHLEEKYGKNIP